MNDAMASRLVAWGLALAACAPKPPNSPQGFVPAAAPALEAHAADPATLSPPTAEEQDLAERLRATVTHLAADIGERNIGKGWNLASATDDLARTLEKMGYEVRRQGIVVGDDVVQNLEVRAGGGEHGAESLVVAAHFDTATGSPGADDNASGTAAVVELARLFRERKTSRAIRFALLANGEAPYFGTEQMGGLVYAKQLVRENAGVVGMMSVDGIGVYGSVRSTQKVEAGFPDTPDFVAVLGNEASRALLEKVARSMKSATMNVAAAVLAPESGAISESDQWAFWKLGLPAVLVTDTGSLRDAHHDTKTDLPSELDFDRMARVVAALARTIEALAAS
jgi:hypothetical protein